MGFQSNNLEIKREATLLGHRAAGLQSQIKPPSARDTYTRVMPSDPPGMAGEFTCSLTSARAAGMQMRRLVRGAPSTAADDWKWRVSDWANEGAAARVIKARVFTRRGDGGGR